MNKIDILYQTMVEYYSGDPKRIQHFIKVHSFAWLIGHGEGIKEQTLFVLEAAALVHDIGIRTAEEKYGNCNGKLQEQEGPAVAKEMLKQLDFSKDVIDRVAYLVGHHHTYAKIDGMDYQILIEADFLVNFYEDELKTDAIKACMEKIFKTETGKNLCSNMFLL